MKLIKYSVGVFTLSFALGCAAVFLSIRNFPVLTDESKPIIAPKTENIAAVETPPDSVEKPFVPEIEGLRDFSDEVYAPKYKFELVDVAAHGNIYRAEEVIAKNGENWLGLFADESGSFLKNSKVRVVVESEPNAPKEKWATINFEEKTPPLFILKNAKNIKPGKISTLFHVTPSEEESVYDESNIMRRGFFRVYQIGEKKYTLRVKDALTKSGSKVLALVLETGNVDRVVTYGPYFDGDYLGYLLWVGDLDGDGKLDFYMDYNNYEKGSFRSSLFLSSEAKKGELVKEAAGFGTSGC